MIRYSEPFLLSRKGSTRATAYGFGSKIVTIDGKTHVVWLDAVAEVCGRTYDHNSGTWGETIRLFEGCDNHTNPAMIADEAGYLHIAYGPHGRWGGWNQGCFKHVVSERPGSLEEWRDEVSFGYNATYACLVNTPSGRDVLAYRGGEPPASLMFEKQRPLGGWTSTRELMRQEIPPQYTHVGATMVCDAQGTLYVGGHFYNAETDGGSAGVAVLKSTDMGETWTDLCGEETPVPILLGERFAMPHGGEGDVRVAGMALDSEGGLWGVTSSVGCATLSHWLGDRWETVDLGRFMPEERVVEGGPMCIDTDDRIHMVTGLNRKDQNGEAWGHPAQEVFHLVSRDRGVNFECHTVSPVDESLPNWLPSISLGGLFHPVEKPVILYTRGVKGVGCSPPDETEVFCVMVEEMA